MASRRLTITDDFTARVRAFADQQTAESREAKRRTWEAIKATQPDLAAFLTEWKALGGTIGAIRYGEPLEASGTPTVTAEQWLAAHRHNTHGRRKK